jgi:hypothetical protein
MTRNLFMFALPVCIAVQLAAPPVPAYAQGAFASVDGVTVDSATKQPLAHVRITVYNPSRGTERTTISAYDGRFNIAKLEPGLYRVNAVHDGFVKSTAEVQVSAPETYRVDLVMAADIAPPPAPTAAKAPAVAVEVPVAAMADELAALKARVMQLEAQKSRTAAPVQTADAAQPDAGGMPAPAPAPGQAPAAAAATPPPPAPIIPDALTQPPPGPTPDNTTPFAYGDFTWLNGTSRNKDEVLTTKWFTPEIRFDTNYIVDFNQPRDHSMGGSTEMFRSGEFQLEQISVGGDFRWDNVRGRVLYMDGMFATTTPRNDASAGVGQWNLSDAYRYVSEAWGGYTFDKIGKGLNVDAGIFVSYIGLFSYYNFDNWTYQPSFVSSNTPWFFNGLRLQYFVTNKLKIEPWIINGWQSYAKYNGHRGLGGQILWMPKEWLKWVFNSYGNGTDDLGVPGRSRIHEDDSVEVRYYNKPESNGIDKMAFSFTVDAGCEYGAGVTCHGGAGGPKQAFLGTMAYDRMWWGKDKYAITIGGGLMNNPGRYLTLLPPINGATAATGTPYFTENPGDQAKMWDTNINFQWMPKQYITWWMEAGYRHSEAGYRDSDVPYWSGRGGITPPAGNTGDPANYVCANGNDSMQPILSAAETACGGGLKSVWFPDLRRGQASLSAGVLVKF